MKEEIKILIIDDSKTCMASLYSILNDQPNIKIVGTASNGLEGLELTKKLKPDLITMDIFMPLMDGVAATKAIMAECPTPILVISSSSNNSELKFVFDALKAGALSVIEKPHGVLEGDFSKIRQEIIDSVHTLAKVPVTSPKQVVPLVTKSTTPLPYLGAQVLVLGSSTGGPKALQYILSTLPANFPIPIAITQHITDGFLPGLMNWLQSTTKLKLYIAQNKQLLEPASVYLANNNFHLLIKKSSCPMAMLDTSKPIHYLRPSIDVMFSSVAENYPGAAIGGLLTGMGKDGAQGLLAMKESGCITFAQSRATSTIYGMPHAAVELDAVHYQIDLENISQFLATLISKGKDHDTKNFDN